MRPRDVRFCGVVAGRPRHGPPMGGSWAPMGPPTQPMGGQVNGSARPWAAQGAHGPPINRLSAHNFPKQDE
ncbi:hypothetical protein N7489_004618 [Penicillium chrysogenum]|uniref:uncharacterized protein n=1 Tax=Penicillium chrysogenum TaxID=5076 RepID=UPI0024DF208E|nr:uncharacterized protein N7489_004618 [Penicillium chrysogenum]KAJ5244522.1 hypothetical protein N7489_004618 [Penicillium chrysogenum]